MSPYKIGIILSFYCESASQPSQQVPKFPRGVLAALALGADGIYMGTRFMVTRESESHTNVKKKLLSKDKTHVLFLYQRTLCLPETWPITSRRNIWKSELPGPPLKRSAPILTSIPNTDPNILVKPMEQRSAADRLPLADRRGKSRRRCHERCGR